MDSSGNVYATGDFAGTANFGSTSLTSAAGDNDIFVAKYGSDGNLVWVRQAGGTFNDTGTRIAVDGAGNCFVTGIFSESAVFGTISLTSANLFDTFLAKYSATGSATIGGTTLTSAGDYDIFVVKFDTAGNPLWTVRGGGSSRDAALDISVDPSGNCFLTGGYTNTTSIGALSLTSDGGTDGYVARLGGGVPVSPARFVPNSLAMTPAGRFRFQISNPAAASVVVEASPNLTTWTPISTNSLAAGEILTFEDEGPVNPQRFYRTKIEP